VKGRISYFLKEKSDRESEREREREREKVKETKNRRERRWGKASEGGEREQVCVDISIPSSVKPLQ
jgi:hypothetical protein